MRFFKNSASLVMEVVLAPLRRGAAWSRKLSLRAKGILACVFLVLYTFCVGSFVAYQRDQLMGIVEQLRAVHRDHDLLTEVNSGLAHSSVTLQLVLRSEDIQSQLLNVQLDLASFTPELHQLVPLYPVIGTSAKSLESQAASLSRGISREILEGLRDTEQSLADTLGHIQRAVEMRDDGLRKEYAVLNRYITVFVSGMNMFCLGVFGAITTVFLFRLSRDVKTLEIRAMAIVNGYRGPHFQVARGDEVGGLMEALNRMQLALRHREQQQEISRQQRFHQEKMAAVGSLAATVAHEVSNPINSISGIAQHTIDALRSGQRLDEVTLAKNAELTLRQTERIGLIMRRLADLSAPRSPDPEPIDVNELVRLTCSFIRYDRRLRNVELVSELDAGLPAAQAVADHLTQILMNLLINAADALEGRTAAGKATVAVSTRRQGDELVLSVIDNGQGMEPSVLAHAFEESFTTKPAGKGRGIGLYLCKILIEEIGGRIELESSLGIGTNVRVYLPVHIERALRVA